MYDFLARFYKRLEPRGLDSMWSCYARPIIRNSRAAAAFKARKENILCVDAGCGTGGLSRELAGYFDVIGIDISSEMLDEASRDRSGGNIIWVQQDISKMNIGKRKAAAVFAVTDVLNHLLLKSKLDAFFRRAYAALESGGYLFFDVITEGISLYYSEDRCAFEDFDWGSFFWTCRYTKNDQKLVYDVSCFEKCEGTEDIYKRTDDTVTERIWPVNVIRESVENAGFRNVQISDSIAYSDFLKDDRQNKTDRLYFVCEKP